MPCARDRGRRSQCERWRPSQGIVTGTVQTARKHLRGFIHSRVNIYVRCMPYDSILRIRKPSASRDLHRRGQDASQREDAVLFFRICVRLSNLKLPRPEWVSRSHPLADLGPAPPEQLALAGLRWRSKFARLAVLPMPPAIWGCLVSLLP
ncbi:hypothetical protein D3C87_1487140 [compost metagenome]